MVIMAVGTAADKYHGGESMKRAVKWAVGLLTVLCWASFALLVGLMVLSSLYWDLLAGVLGEWFFVRVGGVLVGLAMATSGLLAWGEFRANPLKESEYGEWTGKALLYATVFAITFTLSFQFLPSLFFSL
jgi:hypothetical protein